MYNAITISSGHGQYVRGASGILDEVNEARRVVSGVAKYLKAMGVTVNEFHDNTSRTQNDNLKAIVNAHNKTSRALDVSIHFNASSGTQTTAIGTETLYYTSEGAKLATVITDKLATVFKKRSNKERKDLYFLKNTAKTAVLIEVCFVNSKADADAYQANFEKVCQLIAEALCGKTYTPPAPPKPVEPAPAKTRLLTVTTSSLHTYKTKNWDDKSGVLLKKGEVYTVVSDNIKVGGGTMVQIKSGLYVTANSAYVNIR